MSTNAHFQNFSPLADIRKIILSHLPMFCQQLEFCLNAAVNCGQELQNSGSIIEIKRKQCSSTVTERLLKENFLLLLHLFLR